MCKPPPPPPLSRVITKCPASNLRQQQTVQNRIGRQTQNSPALHTVVHALSLSLIALSLEGYAYR